jgi:hypothetical protein
MKPASYILSPVAVTSDVDMNLYAWVPDLVFGMSLELLPI